MITKDLLNKIFSSFSIERWNDKIRPNTFSEIDKQAHKLIIAFFIGNFEKDNNFNWIEIIEGGIFEFLQRIIITDIKPQVFEKIKSDKKKYKELNEWILQQIENNLISIDKNFYERYKDYFFSEKQSINKRILEASHIFSSKWEFDIIEHFNPDKYDIERIKNYFQNKIEQYYDIEGFKQLLLYKSYYKFIDLCGQLRFQIRWANLNRTPKTSVLGHSFFVAILTYFISLEINCCSKRLYNNFFTGLFHDLPEILTRDIISPVKKSIEGLSDLIKDYEKELMNNEVYPLLPENIKNQLIYFTENEFENTIILNNEIKTLSSDEINKNYNSCIYNPKDGFLVKSMDDLSAFIEALAAIENGSKNIEFKQATTTIRNKYLNIGLVAGIDFKRIYNQFKI